MPAKTRVHRASAQRRRNALIAAAAELAAEVGAGAVTHRAVAARAGVPLSTTSYFFSSIDDLVAEALQVGSSGRFDSLEATAKAAAGPDGSDAEEAIAAVAREAVSTPRSVEGDQIELFLAAGRDEELRGHVASMVEEITGRIQDYLALKGAEQPEAAAWTLTALGDGAMLHRFAEIDPQPLVRLEQALRLVMAAAVMTDDELDTMLDRYRTT
jgi:DNA-binding transcriptional regulator YbjK